MPRQFPGAVAGLAALPTIAADEAGAIDAALHEYVLSLRVYHALELRLDDESLARAAQLWKHRVDLRPLLGSLVFHYPCPQLLRPLRRALVANHRDADLGAWLRAYPALAGELRPAYVARAMRFQRPFVAVPSALVWARHLGGGDEAYRAAALAIHREDRVAIRRRRGGEVTSDFLRHDLQDHGRLFAAEVERINRHLTPLGGEPLEFQGMGFWWQAPPIEFEHAPAQHGYLLSWAAYASSRRAGAAWGEADEAVYAERLARMEPWMRAGFVTRAPRGDRPVPALERIVRRVT